MSPEHAAAVTRLAFFSPQLSTGGTGKVLVELTRELVARGYPVDLLLGQGGGPYARHLDPRVRTRVLGTTHPLASLPGLAAYLREARPAAVFTDRARLNAALLRARRLARVASRVCMCFHVPLSGRLERIPPRKGRAELATLRRCLPRDEGVIAVSRGVAEDLVSTLGAAAGRVVVVYNPIVTAEIERQAAAQPDHPFTRAGVPALVMGAGRLTPQKDFPTLLRAFARVRQQRPCRLIILGEGPERGPLERLTESLGLAGEVALPGFTGNLYAYLARARVFVLSSIWEGFGNVLAEAMAVGTPVVATDCPFGPREILEDGRLGPLVPPGDEAALAEAIARTLDHPPAAQALRQSARRFTAARCADGYLAAAALNG
jgi:glycosyltransferase involved in cell wall biosynthesis